MLWGILVVLGSSFEVLLEPLSELLEVLGRPEGRKRGSMKCRWSLGRRFLRSWVTWGNPSGYEHRQGAPGDCFASALGPSKAISEIF